eukprot:scaffold126474_cov15-Tisochrysis_lutea.AAC.1
MGCVPGTKKKGERALSCMQKASMLFGACRRLVFLQHCLHAEHSCSETSRSYSSFPWSTPRRAQLPSAAVDADAHQQGGLHTS